VEDAYPKRRGGGRMRTQLHVERELWRQVRELALEEQERRGHRVTAADLVNEALAEWLRRRGDG